ncbi:YceI family protein [Streptacidiphilus anmyonensis]|uniref:YceI family protein n=1 Tax=Streptacidiphilus anmyonensis TaxID=405782 RepID=UPI0005AA0270|nr:YceI family protein [Streptacidiphilus anmyonensis]
MTTTTTTLGLGRYVIDPSGSSVTFTTRHLFGLGLVRGSFAIRSGSVDLAEPLAASVVTAELDAAGFATGNGSRDATVRSAKLLDTDRHPRIVFVSERVCETEVAGTLTACGVSRPVRLAVTDTTVSAEGSGFHVRATTRIDRTDFGVTAMRGLAGRHLDLTVQVTCVHASLRDGTAGWAAR